ncbi:MAG: hypothetical protein FWG81_05710 [Betaproteobacteria bacterium]|nr:hypothetical protein [Betaproteobacteria bacterium]
MRYLIALVFCFLLASPQAYALYPRAADEIFLNTIPDPQLDVDVIAKVSLSDVNEAQDTATANIMQVIKTSDPRVRQGSKILLKTVVARRGSNPGYDREGIIAAKIIADKDGLALHPYTYTRDNGCLRPPRLLSSEWREQPDKVMQEPVCGFPDLKLPSNFAVLFTRPLNIEYYAAYLVLGSLK